MWQLQLNGLDSRRPVFQKELNHAFILVGVIGAGRIDQATTRLEKIEGPDEKVTLQSRQVLTELGCMSESTILTGAQEPLGRTWHIRQNPIKSQSLGELLAGIADGNGIVHSQPLQI